MKKLLVLLGSVAVLAACNQSNEASSNGAASQQPKAAALSLTRLDCGKITIKKFDDFYPDNPGLYPKGPHQGTDSCYLIRHGSDIMLWDTGLPASLKGHDLDNDETTMHLDRTVAEQLGDLGITPDQVNVVAISHHHPDHVSQSSSFPAARLLIGPKDFELAQKPEQPGAHNPLAPWASGKNVEKVVADKDVFGDGKVIMLSSPGHTETHHSLLVNLASGPVLLTGDLYHTDEARSDRAVPKSNVSKPDTLKSMDRIEALVKKVGAKVIIQHEVRDISKLPAFPAAAE